MAAGFEGGAPLDSLTNVGACMAGAGILPNVGAEELGNLLTNVGACLVEAAGILTNVGAFLVLAAGILSREVAKGAEEELGNLTNLNAFLGEAAGTLSPAAVAWKSGGSCPAGGGCLRAAGSLAKVGISLGAGKLPGAAAGVRRGAGRLAAWLLAMKTGTILLEPSVLPGDSSDTEVKSMVSNKNLLYPVHLVKAPVSFSTDSEPIKLSFIFVLLSDPELSFTSPCLLCLIMIQFSFHEMLCY